MEGAFGFPSVRFLPALCFFNLGADAGASLVKAKRQFFRIALKSIQAGKCQSQAVKGFPVAFQLTDVVAVLAQVGDVAQIGRPVAEHGIASVVGQ